MRAIRAVCLLGFLGWVLSSCGHTPGSIKEGQPCGETRDCAAGLLCCSLSGIHPDELTCAPPGHDGQCPPRL